MQAQQHHGTDDFVAYSGPGCEEESWSPEVLSFYGDGETVLRKMGNFEMQLPRRRIYMFLLETVGAQNLCCMRSKKIINMQFTGGVAKQRAV